MLVGVTTFELHLPHSRSLKEKRRVVRGLVDRLYSRHRVSVVESDYHDLHQRAEIAIAVVALSETEIRRMTDDIRETVDRADALVTLWSDRILEALP